VAKARDKVRLAKEIEDLKKAAGVVVAIKKGFGDSSGRIDNQIGTAGPRGRLSGPPPMPRMGSEKTDFFKEDPDVLAQRARKRANNR